MAQETIQLENLTITGSDLPGVMGEDLYSQIIDLPGVLDIAPDIDIGVPDIDMGAVDIGGIEFLGGGVSDVGRQEIAQGTLSKVWDTVTGLFSSDDQETMLGGMLENAGISRDDFLAKPESERWTMAQQAAAVGAKGDGKGKGNLNMLFWLALQGVALGLQYRGQQKQFEEAKRQATTSEEATQETLRMTQEKIELQRRQLAVEYDLAQQGLAMQQAALDQRKPGKALKFKPANEFAERGQ